MLEHNNTIKLLGLEDVIIGEIYEIEKTRYIPIQLPRKAQICPRCGKETDLVHDYRIQYVKDLDSFGYATVLVLRKRRYCCKECKKRFAETNPFLPKYFRRTQRVIIQLLENMGEMYQGSMSQKKTMSHVPHYGDISHNYRIAAHVFRRFCRSTNSKETPREKSTRQS